MIARIIPSRPDFLKKWKWILITPVAAFNLIYLVWLILFPPANSFLTDFHSYWYSGLFIRQRIDPYEAFFNNKQLTFPITFLGGIHTESEEILDRANSLEIVPANTAPVVLILSLFSFLNWSTAGSLWIAINILLTILISLLITTYLNLPPLLFTRLDKLFAIVLIFSLNATARGIIANGQTTIFILFFMMLSLYFLDKGKKELAGISLGIALSKYSVSFPVLILFIFRKELIAILFAVLIQFFSSLLLSWVGASSLLSIGKSYWNMMVFHAMKQISKIEGIHLTEYFRLEVSIVILVLLTLLVIWISYFYMDIKRNQKVNLHRLTEQSYLSVLIPFSLIAVYHLGYDAVLLIFSFLFLFQCFENVQAPSIDERLQTVRNGVLLILVLIMCVPGSVYRYIFSSQNAHNAVTTFTTLITFLIAALNFFFLTGFLSRKR